ncbi:MAG: ABC transporter ATP-binding protein [Anaerolineales bacterium]|nr:ABC transporter ATP-binding protein [Anaerolineales bacterium]
MSTLEIKSIHKSFGEAQALRGVSFSIQRNEIVAVLGPSGCGKSTLLSIIAGLEAPDEGEVYWEEKLIGNIPTHQRNFGLMFQDFALFPHMDVEKNIAFGLRMGDMAQEAMQQRVKEMLALVGLPGYEKRDVNTLSGGEQQRVALARALAPGPQLLMLDEPLGSLDRNLRERLMSELPGILHHAQQTVLYVTHDQEEAFAIAGRIVVLNAGQVEQVGSPQEIYCCPSSPFVARFLEMPNLIPAQVYIQDGQSHADTALGKIPLPPSPAGPAQVLIRPDSADIGDHAGYLIQGRLVERSFRGHRQRVMVEAYGQRLVFDFPSAAQLPAEGNQVTLSFDPLQALRVFPGKG